MSNTLGAEFLEKAYQRALLHELCIRGIRAAADVSFAVTYKGRGVGEYFADILVEALLAIELKCAERLSILRPNSLLARQFPETQGRVEANRPRVSDF